MSTTVDPLAVLRWSALHEPRQLAERVERVCTAGEIDFAHGAAPTAGAHDLLAACQVACRPVVIVSTNAPETIRAYLDRHILASQVLDVVGRRLGQPELMKPHPDSITRALAVVHEPAERCAFLGDSLTDIEVAHTTGVRASGYAEHARRGEELAAAGADALTADLSRISRSIAAGHHPVMTNTALLNQGPRSARPAARVLAALRAAPPFSQSSAGSVGRFVQRQAIHR